MSKRRPSGLSDDRTEMGKFSNFDSVPKEIVTEIMSRLSPESLMRCKCLNKSWYFVIKCLVKNPEFVAKHLHHSKASPQTLVVSEHERRLCNPPQKNPGLPEAFYDELVTSMIITEFVENGDVGDIDCVTQLVNLPHYFTTGETPCLEVYYCNGIVCLTIDFKTFTLYNPVLREFEDFHPKTDLNLADHSIYGMGLGSDSSARNFKIVRLLNPLKAEVFTPGSITDSWREINISIRYEQHGNMDDHLYFKGNCFWLFSGVERLILCFNVCTEVFRSIPLPNKFHMPEDPFWKLTLYNDSVCLFWLTGRESIGRESIDMWIIDVDSDGGNGCYNYSWRKCMRTELFEGFKGFDAPLTFWKGDELLVETEDGKIVSYNLHTGQLRNLSLTGMLVDIFHWSVFVKSLVSVKGMRQG